MDIFSIQKLRSSLEARKMNLEVNLYMAFVFALHGHRHLSALAS